jgi:hypothetical protein
MAELKAELKVDLSVLQWVENLVEHLAALTAAQMDLQKVALLVVHWVPWWAGLTGHMLAAQWAVL